MDFVCATCADKNHEQFRFFSRSEFERHVAIFHGEGAYSTMRCGKCQRKYYDFPHFEEHTKWSPICDPDNLIMNRDPLTDLVKAAFSALVTSMIRPLEIAAPLPVESSVSLQSAKEECDVKPSSAMNSIVSIDISDENCGANNSGVPLFRNASDFSETFRPQDTPPISGSYWSIESSRSPFPSTSFACHPAESYLSSSASVPMVVDKEAWSPELGQSVQGYSISGAGSGHVSDNAVQKSSSSYQDGQVMQLCREIVCKRHCNGYIKCLICKSDLKVVTAANTGYRFGNMIDHANQHSENLLFWCKFCTYKTAAKALIRTHFTKHHGSIAVDLDSSAFYDCSEQYADKTMEMLTKCFDHEVVAADVGASRIRKMPRKQFRRQRKLRPFAGNIPKMDQTIRRSPAGSKIGTRAMDAGAPRQFLDSRLQRKNGLVYARQARALGFIKKYTNKKLLQLECRLCNKKIIVGSKRSNRRNERCVYGSRFAIDHAVSHTNKRILLCRLCDYGASRVESGRYHIKHSHGLDDAAANLINISDQFHDEIMNSLSLCFDHGAVAGSQGPTNHPEESVAPKQKVKKEPETKGKQLKRFKPQPNLDVYKCNSCGWTTKVSVLLQRHMKSNICNVAAAGFHVVVKDELS